MAEAPAAPEPSSSLLPAAAAGAGVEVSELAEEFWQWKLVTYPEMAAHDHLNLHSEDLESFSFDAFAQRVVSVGQGEV